MSKMFLAALAASTLLAGAAIAADATAATPAKTKPAAAPATPLVPFTGKASSFKPGTDDKTATVSDKAGDWFTLSFSASCKGLDGAKAVTLAQTKTAGWAKFSAKSKCKVSSFEKAVASNDAAPATTTTPAPAATTTTPAPAATTPAPTPTTH